MRVLTVVAGWITMERPSADVIILVLLGRQTGSCDVSSNILQLTGRASTLRISLRHLMVDKPGRRASRRDHCVLQGQIPVAVLPASAATASSAARWIASSAR